MTSDELLAARLQALGTAAPELNPGIHNIIPRAKRRRAATRTLALGGVLLAGGGLALSALVGGSPVIPAATHEPTTATPSPSTASSAPDPATALTVVPGWSDAGADPAQFAGATVTGAVAWQGSVVAVGCDQGATTSGSLGRGDAPIWVGAGADWQRSGPVSLPGREGAEGTRVTCIDQVVATPYGLFAAAGAGVIHSDDGLSWDTIELDPGYGWVEAIMTSGDRVTVLSSQASLNESRVATLWTTTDGLAWVRVGGGEGRDEAGVGNDPAVVFDNGDVFDVITVTGGFVAVGASPGGEFVPTAAAWTSTDSVNWQRETVEDADECYLTAVAATSPDLLAAGWCAITGQPAMWTSKDGTAWQRTTAPVADLPQHSFVRVSALTVLDDGVIAVAGTVYMGGDGTEEAAQWLLTDDWQRADDSAAPYHVVDGTGFWPPTGSNDVTVLLAK